MATITFSMDIPETKNHNLSEFQQKIKAYARMLVEMPISSMTGVKQQKKNDANSFPANVVLSREEAEKFIHSLPIRGAKEIPEYVNGPKDLPNAKYM